MSSQVSSLVEDLIIEEREEFMVSPLCTGGLANKRIAHFLKPTVASLEDSSLKLPLLSPKQKWALDLKFDGWQVPVKMWEKWVDKLFPKYHLIWRKVGILEAILSSKYKFKKNFELIFGITERWSPVTNTFVFPWGEASITLEDMMILGGLSVLGGPVLLPLVENDLVYIETNMKKELEKFEKMKSYTHIRWIDFFMRHNSQYEHEAFLTSWLSRFVFPVDDINKIDQSILPTAIRLARGTKIALAPTVLASLYRDLSLLKETMTASTKLVTEEGKGNILKLNLWSPFHLVQLWAWERLQPFQPKPNSLKPGEPRMARWHGLQRLQIGNVRRIIDSSREIFQWRPYCVAIDNWIFPSFYKETEERVHIGQHLDEELESFARCLRVCLLIGRDCKEAYLPHRVAMQFGYDQDLPGLVSHPNSCSELAFAEYSRPLSNNESLYFLPRLAKPQVSIRYLNWWRKTVLALANSAFVPRRKRSLRIARTYSPVSQHMRAIDTEFDAEKVQVPTTSVKVSNMKVEQEDNYPSVPPGFSPKFMETISQNDLPNSSSRCQSARPETSTMRMIDLNLPPDSPPTSQSARPEISNELMIDLNLPPPDSPLTSQSARPETSNQRMIDLNLPPPDSPLTSQSARPETSNKRMIDLNLPPPDSPEEGLS